MLFDPNPGCSQLRIQDLEQFVWYYNHQRPHLSLHGLTPVSRRQAYFEGFVQRVDEARQEDYVALGQHGPSEEDAPRSKSGNNDKLRHQPQRQSGAWSEIQALALRGELARDFLRRRLMRVGRRFRRER